VLARREADPGGEVAPLGEDLARWREGSERRGRDRADPRIVISRLVVSSPLARWRNSLSSFSI
jgi:hypothetical protein